MPESRLTSQPTMKDDRAGSLRSALSSHADRGRRLLRAGGLISSNAEFETWRFERRSWRVLGARTVAAEFEQEAIYEFLLVTSEAGRGADWEQALAAELRGLRNGVELLELLRSTLELRESRCARAAL
jgi:hypothetical protein